MPNKIKTEYPEIDGIKDDLESLKTNVVELTKHVQANSTQMTYELAQVARKQIDQLQARGRDELRKVERRIQEQPAQSLMIAFAAGMFASFILRRRG